MRRVITRAIFGYLGDFCKRRFSIVENCKGAAIICNRSNCLKTRIIYFFTIFALNNPVFASEKPTIVKEDGEEVVINFVGMEIYFPRILKDKIEISGDRDRWSVEANSIEVKYTGSDTSFKKSPGYANLAIYAFPCSLNDITNNIVRDLNDEKRHFDLSIQKSALFNGVSFYHREIQNMFMNYLVFNNRAGNCYNFNYSLDTFTDWTSQEILSSLPQIDQWIKKSIDHYTGTKS